MGASRTHRSARPATKMKGPSFHSNSILYLFPLLADSKSSCEHYHCYAYHKTIAAGVRSLRVRPGWPTSSIILRSTATGTAGSITSVATAGSPICCRGSSSALLTFFFLLPRRRPPACEIRPLLLFSYQCCSSSCRSPDVPASCACSLYTSFLPVIFRDPPVQYFSRVARSRRSRFGR